MDSKPDGYTNNYPDPIRQSDRDDFDAIDSLSDGDVDIYADRNTDGNGNLDADPHWVCHEYFDSYINGDYHSECDPYDYGDSDANPHLH